MRAVTRRAVGGLGVVALTAVGFAVPAHAEDTPLPVTITGPDRVDLSLVPDDNGDPTEPQVRLGLRAPGESVPDENGIIYPIHQGDYRITIDASELAGVASVDFPCPAQGLIAVCDAYEIYAGEEYNRTIGVRLDVAADSAAGDFGTIKVTGEGAGLDFTSHTVGVLVGGPELWMRQLAEPAGFAAGDTYPAPLGFRNVGGLGGQGVVLRVWGSRGLTFADAYSNCSYERGDRDDPYARNAAVCVFDDAFEAGTAYGLSKPFRVRTAGFALDDVLSYSFSEVPVAQARHLLAEPGHPMGDGERLTLVPRQGADPGDYARYAELDFPTRNSYDLDLTGDTARGREGDTVRLQVGFRNHGPAWLALLRAGGESIGFHVDIPAGATVTRHPDTCFPQDWEGAEGDYLCWISTPIMEDDVRAFPFELRIDQVVDNARGSAYFPHAQPKESRPSNDSATLVLNPSAHG